MRAPRIPDDEQQRLDALRSYAVLDTLPEPCFDDLTALAAHLFDVPIALVSLVDEHRQWFKSRHGLEATETPREISFCGHVVESGSALVVPDARRDERFADNPLVTGPPHVCFYAGTPLRTGDGAILGTLCIIDHGPRTATAEKLDLLHALGRQVIAQLDLRLELKRRDETIEALESVERIKAELVSTASHELRTPLTAISGALGLITGGAMGALSPALADLVEVADQNVKRLIRLVNDMLDLDKLAQGRLELRCEPLSLAELATQSVRTHEALAAQANLDVVLDGDAASTQVSADPDRITQVLDNLISNAIQHAPDSSQIDVQILRRDACVEASVTDRGPGIPEQFQARVFERFAQAEQDSRRLRGGSGLGLSISRSIVEAHGGRIGFESKPGHGARFWFTLPAG